MAAEYLFRFDNIGQHGETGVIATLAGDSLGGNIMDDFHGTYGFAWEMFVNLPDVLFPRERGSWLFSGSIDTDCVKRTAPAASVV